MFRWVLAIKALVYGLLWPATCWATAITLGDTMQHVPTLAWLMVLVLSAVSGLAALLSRLRDHAPERLTLFVVSHMLASLVAGLLVFFACEGADINDFAEAVAIALAAYGGAKLIDRMSDKFTERAGL